VAVERSRGCSVRFLQGSTGLSNNFCRRDDRCNAFVVVIVVILRRLLLSSSDCCYLHS
jgi:hypothetical protein